MAHWMVAARVVEKVACSAEMTVDDLVACSVAWMAHLMVVRWADSMVDLMIYCDVD